MQKKAPKVTRVFPLWPDFQPLTAHEKWSSLLREVRMKEEPLPDTPLGRAGVDPVMIERFRNEMGYRRSGKQRIIALILPRRNAIAGFYPSALLQRIVKHPPRGRRWRSNILFLPRCRGLLPLS